MVFEESDKSYESHSSLHVTHEGNSEQLFSRSGDLSDDNGKMDPARLGVWTSIGVNYSTFQPSDKQIIERYIISSSLAPAAKLSTCMKTTSDCLMQTASKVRRPQAERCMSRPLMGSERGEQQSQLQARRAPVVGGTSSHPGGPLRCIILEWYS